MLIKRQKVTLGTKEWADSNVNCYLGCSNNCRYCYAKKMAVRFKRDSENTWKVMKANQKNISKNYKKRNGRVMFPTSHDITEASLKNCLIVLDKLIKAGNDVLITSKPQFQCIKKICDNFFNYKELIQFRFTITSIDNEILGFWEPRAPNFEERILSLKYAYEMGFKTSISIEPFLDNDPYILIDFLIPYVTESIWIGKMNYIQKHQLNHYERLFYKKVRENNQRSNLLQIINRVGQYSNNIIRIKDSIYNYLKKNHSNSS
ncbi:hypothetical protein LCGC14_0459800 [marine sediment metagenome]|uniref:Radical SAM core domain-containing protein n=1 Tax=marine sediment metagenome TaxID=412755 RepID=A0A0F9SY42_9ZZZZ|nr:hypothetical protein [bacterium]